MTSPSIETICAHLGSDYAGAELGPFQTPIVQSTLFHLGTSAQAEELFAGKRKGYAYSRFGNPTVEVLAQAYAALEGGAEALVTSSGNAAVHCALSIALRGRGGPIVAPQDLYGGSVELLRVFASIYGVAVENVDARDNHAWLAAVGRARVVLLESPSNPLLRLTDIVATVAAARAAGAVVVVDNTVATPYNQRPLALGADLVVHSTSKYLNGHSDMIGGCVVAREPLAPEARALHKNLGATVNAMEAWLILRGLRTFALRMEAHNRNGRAVAQWLAAHPRVRHVYYPGLGEGDHELFGRQMRGGSGLLSFEIEGGKAAAQRFLDRLGLVLHAVSLGGMESLATLPSATSHRGMGAEERARAGIAEGLVRLSVGVEAAGDIEADLHQALAD
ncbi:MAG: aminotransferase class I/II-fold pyridoxal phosphate-dependent enzyme [Gammaproteobacteria bacterium]